MIAPDVGLRTSAGELRLGGRLQLMGILNATPDSFSEIGAERTLTDRVALAAAMLEAGADVLDIGGESARTDRPAVAVAEEIERVAPVVAAVTGQLGAVVSVDTYKPEVAAAAIAAGASIVNDISALRDPELADVCAETGAGLILMHTRAAPKQKVLDAAWDGRMAADVVAMLSELIERAIDRGVAEEQIMLDPGPDFGKTPAQTVESLRALADLHRFGRPLLAAISRKDFIGVVCDTAPQDRGAGTLGALAFVQDAGAHMARLHDVGAAHDFLAVRGVLNGAGEIAPDARLAEHLRRRR